jgi:hypothetical protein
MPDLAAVEVAAATVSATWDDVLLFVAVTTALEVTAEATLPVEEGTLESTELEDGAEDGDDDS